MIAATIDTVTTAGAAAHGSRVVVATLGDDESFAAVAWAVALARDGGSHVAVIRAEPADPNRPAPADDKSRCERVAADLRRRLDAAGLAADEIRCERGTPGAVVLGAAAGARLLVIESHRPKDGHRFAHGHLAPELARHAACPLIVVPRGHVEPPGEVVVGIGGRVGDEVVVERAQSIAAAFDCPVSAVHVRDPLASIFCTRPGDPAEREARRTATTAGVDLITRTSEHPAVELLDVATTRSAGLIVVGTEQVPGVFTPILGYVTARLLEQDDVAVAVVPAGGIGP